MTGSFRPVDEVSILTLSSIELKWGCSMLSIHGSHSGLEARRARIRTFIARSVLLKLVNSEVEKGGDGINRALIIKKCVSYQFKMLCYQISAGRTLVGIRQCQSCSIWTVSIRTSNL